MQLVAVEIPVQCGRYHSGRYVVETFKLGVVHLTNFYVGSLIIILFTLDFNVSCNWFQLKPLCNEGTTLVGM